jgi:predicted ATP-dependent protease
MAKIETIGSVKQHDQIQAIGGINEKVEGFYFTWKMAMIGLREDHTISFKPERVDATICESMTCAFGELGFQTV